MPFLDGENTNHHDNFQIAHKFLAAIDSKRYRKDVPNWSKIAILFWKYCISHPQECGTADSVQDIDVMKLEYVVRYAISNAATLRMIKEIVWAEVDDIDDVVSRSCKIPILPLMWRSEGWPFQHIRTRK